MPIYRITNKTSGAELGTYHAASPEAALDAMAREAGYSDQAEALEVVGSDGSDLRVTELSHVEIVVPADADEDDCLAAAAEAYVADHPALKGYDLEPHWTDDDVRDTVTLLVPAWAAPVELAQITARVTGRGAGSTVPDNAGAVDAEIEINGIDLGSVTLLPDEHGWLSAWGDCIDCWADHQLLRWIDERVEAGGQDRTEVIRAIVAAVNEAAK